MAQVVDVKVGTVLLRQDHGEEKLASAAEDKTVGTDDDKSINYWETPYFWGILEGEVILQIMKRMGIAEQLLKYFRISICL